MFYLLGYSFALTAKCVNVSWQDSWRRSKKWTLADAELENLPLPNLSQPSSILSPAHLREVKENHTNSGIGAGSGSGRGIASWLEREEVIRGQLPSCEIVRKSCSRWKLSSKSAKFRAKNSILGKFKNKIEILSTNSFLCRKFAAVSQILSEMHCLCWKIVTFCTTYNFNSC